MQTRRPYRRLSLIFRLKTPLSYGKLYSDVPTVEYTPISTNRAFGS